MKVIITIEAEIDELEAECFNNNMSDENLDGQADLVKDIMRMGHFSRHGVNPKINWKVEADATFNPWRLIGIK
jgi:hypothetical protein